MREQLVGYLLNALDLAEQEAIEAHLSRDPQLRRELELLARSLTPLAADRGHYEPPAGLASRTCEFVATRSQAAVRRPAAVVVVPSRWNLTDFAMAAGIFLAATLLFFPALQQSQFAARVTGCQNNLRQMGIGLADYANLHNGYFPHVASEGRFAGAGIFFPMLIDQRLLPNTNVVICPASELAGRVDRRLPTLQELRAANDRELEELHRIMGGSYAYALGYIKNGQYYANRNLGRMTFAILADVPNSQPPYCSPNHDRRGQNVLFEDGHVQFLTTCEAPGCRDNVYLNDRHEVGPGMHVNDAVLVPSHAKPRFAPTARPVPPASQP